MEEEKVRAVCPRCGKVIIWKDNPYRPFCSQKCRLIDLGKWIEEEYRISEEKPMPEVKEKDRGEGV